MKSGDGSVWLFNAIAVVGVPIFLSGILVLGYQSFLWLQQGYWTPIRLRQFGSLLSGGPAIADPVFGWQGVQKIAIWVLDAPLGVTLMLVGIGMSVLGIYAADDVRNRQLFDNNSDDP